MSGARYSIGIDLGTTHCALSYVDTSMSDGEKTTLAVLPIAQLTGPGAIDDLDLLPSFLYLPHPDELGAGDLHLGLEGKGQPLPAADAAEHGAHRASRRPQAERRH